LERDMSQTTVKYDRRLLGTWQSDRGRTLKNWKSSAKSVAKRKRAQRVFHSIFGKLVIRWTRRRWHSEYDGERESRAYEIVASDFQSVVIHSVAPGSKGQLTYIRFIADGYYCVITVAGILEYFKRIE
jgi:hypothetical protein